MNETRRSFLKKAAVVGAISAVAGVASAKQTYSSNGVVSGKSPKKEILYTKTQTWENYYQAAK